MASLSFHATWEQRAPLEVRPLEVSRSHLSTVIYPPLLTSTLVSKSSNQPEPFPHSRPRHGSVQAEDRAQALVHTGQVFSHWATSGVLRHNWYRYPLLIYYSNLFFARKIQKGRRNTPMLRLCLSFFLLTCVSLFPPEAAFAPHQTPTYPYSEQNIHHWTHH